MNRHTIFQFSNYRDYLKVVGERHLSRRSRPITLDAWCKRLGYRSPRSVAMVLKGQRLPSRQMVNILSKDLNHSVMEHRYFELLVERERVVKKDGNLHSVLCELEKFKPKKSIHNISLESFSYIAEWYHLVIKQLVATPTFQENTLWISRRLRGAVTASEINRAIGNMIDLGVLVRNAKGKLQVQQESLVTSSDIPNSAVRSHHKGMMARAVVALEEKDFHNREMTSITMRVSPKDMLAAKAEIRRFRDSFHKKFESVDSQGVYQLNIQFFEHTSREKKGEKNATH